MNDQVDEELKILTKAEKKHEDFMYQSRQKNTQPELNEYQQYLIRDFQIQSEESDLEIKQKEILNPLAKFTRRFEPLKQMSKQFSSSKSINKSKSKSFMERQQSKMLGVERKKTMVMKQASMVYKSVQQPTIQVERANDHILSADGNFKIFWDLLCMTLILYEIISIPFQISFDVVLSEEFDVLVDILFGLDIVLNFNTSYYYQGIPISNRRKIALNYLAQWFWIDLCASFPYSRVIEFALQDQEEVDVVSSKQTLVKKTKILRQFTNQQNPQGYYDLFGSLR